MNRVELGVGRLGKCLSQLWAGGSGSGSGSVLPQAEEKLLLLGFPFSKMEEGRLGTTNREV